MVEPGAVACRRRSFLRPHRKLSSTAAFAMERGSPSRECLQSQADVGSWRIRGLHHHCIRCDVLRAAQRIDARRAGCSGPRIFHWVLLVAARRSRFCVLLAPGLACGRRLSCRSYPADKFVHVSVTQLSGRGGLALVQTGARVGAKMRFTDLWRWGGGGGRRTVVLLRGIWFAF